jgi:hypothetical protein
MLTHPEKARQDFGTPSTRVAPAQPDLPSVGELPCECAGADARMKVINPLTSTGPSVRALVVNESASELIVRFPRAVFAGALVQVRTQGKIVFGEARRCTSKGSEYEIYIEKKELY